MSYLSAADVTVQDLPSGKGVKIFIADDSSDSLVIIEATRHNGRLSAKLGLRGNFDARSRPLRWVYTYMDAPDVSESTRAQRRADYLRRMGR